MRGFYSFRDVSLRKYQSLRPVPHLQLCLWSVKTGHLYDFPPAKAHAGAWVDLDAGKRYVQTDGCVVRRR